MSYSPCPPILFLIFNRPDTTAEVFSAIREARPRQLFVAADGPRTTHSTDDHKCQLTRAVVDSIDWDCEVQTLYRAENLGCKRAVESAIDWYFSKVECGVILEDDCLPSPDFFPFCEQLLRRYADSKQVMTITGNNFHQCCFRASTSYFFSKYMHCWGWATWRRAWEAYNSDLTLGPGQTDEQVICNFPTSPGEIRYWRNRFAATRNHQRNTWDYGWQFSVWAQSGLTATPQVNLVKNIGFGVDGTHTRSTTGANNPPALSLQIESHPLTISQDQRADAHGFAHVIRAGRRTWLERCLKEAGKVFRRLAPQRC